MGLVVQLRNALAFDRSLFMTQKIPFLVALTGMFFGVLIAIIFGANEDFFKDQIKAGLQLNSKVIELSKSEEPEAKAELAKFIDGESSKNWRYYQRFHFHSTGIGAMSLGALLLLSLLVAPKAQVLIASYMIAIGGFLYPFVWLLAAVYGPMMGRDVAKETFAIFGYMGGVFMVGILFAIYLVARFQMHVPTKTLPAE